MPNIKIVASEPMLKTLTMKHNEKDKLDTIPTTILSPKEVYTVGKKPTKLAQLLNNQIQEAHVDKFVPAYQKNKVFAKSSINIKKDKKNEDNDYTVGSLPPLDTNGLDLTKLGSLKP